MWKSILPAALAAVIVVAGTPAEAKHKKDRDWQQPWYECNDWDCDDQGKNGWQPGWQPDWQPGWQNKWNNDHDGWGKPSRVSKGEIARTLQQNGYERIYDIRLDDDGVIYIVRAWDWRGRLTKLFFDARNGRFVSKSFAD